MQPFAHYSFDRVEFTKSNVTIYVDVSEMQKGKWYNFIHIESDSIELGPQISAFLAQLNQTMREHNALSKLLMNLKLFNLQIFNLVEKLRPQTKDLHNAISEENVLEQFCAKNSNITDQEDAAEAKWSNKDLFDVLLASTAIKVDLEFVDKNINAADELINQMTQTEQTQIGESEQKLKKKLKTSTKLLEEHKAKLQSLRQQIVSQNVSLSISELQSSAAAEIIALKATQQEDLKKIQSTTDIQSMKEMLIENANSKFELKVEIFALKQKIYEIDKRFKQLLDQNSSNTQKMKNAQTENKSLQGENEALKPQVDEMSIDNKNLVVRHFCACFQSDVIHWIKQNEQNERRIPPTLARMNHAFGENSNQFSTDEIEKIKEFANMWGKQNSYVFYEIFKKTGNKVAHPWIWKDSAISFGQAEECVIDAFSKEFEGEQAIQSFRQMRKFLEDRGFYHLHQVDNK